MIEKLKLIYRILKGEIVTLSQFEKQIAELANEIGEEEYFVSVRKGNYSFLKGGKTTFSCGIEYKHYCKESSSMEQSIHDMKNHIKGIIAKEDLGIKIEQEVIIN